MNQQRLRQRLHYNPDTGIFTWNESHGARKVGSVAGSQNSLGYICIGVAKSRHKAHRLAWLYMTGEWPPELIDHIDGDPTNNRWNNLRCATRAQNAMNTKLRSNNNTGYKGVSQKHGKYLASVAADGANTHLGTFDTAEEAYVVACATREQRHGEFARQQ